MGTHARWCLTLGLLITAGACGSPFVSGDTGSGGSGADVPADAAGEYTVAITNGDNGCSFGGWDPGQSTPDIPFTITQSGADVTGTVGDYVGDLMKSAYGSNVFVGRVEGSLFTMKDEGTKEFTSGGCVASIDILAQGEITGDAIQGTLVYDPKTNGHADCGAFNTCTSTQQFSGARPPKP
jgi:hypothetical protein